MNPSRKQQGLPQIKQVGMTNAEYLKALRADASARGLCYVCRKRFPRPGLRDCDVCQDRASSGISKIIAKGLCPRCCKRRRSITGQQCWTCQQKTNEKARKSRKMRIDAGTCQANGCRHPSAPGRVSCFECLKRIRERVKKVYANRVVLGICARFGCYDKPEPGHVYCQCHLDHTNANSRAYRVKQIKQRVSSAR